MIFITISIHSFDIYFSYCSKCPSNDGNECLRLLFDNATSADVNLLNSKKQSPLHVAVILKKIEWVRKILSLDSNINAQVGAVGN